jgi:hypothetical protein
MYRVLSIDGGGIRGVIPAVLLVQLEQRTGKPVSAMFDLVVGTSTGGILAAGLTCPKANGAAKFTAQDMLELYAERGREIFQRSFWDGITSLGGLADEQYDAAPLEKLLRQYLGDATLTDCIKPVVVTSYDIERREPYFFKTRRARASKDRNHLLRDVARATSAAPTYFEPAVVRSLAARPTRRALVDGGVFINNPALAGYIEALTMGQKADDILVLSLGTGVATRPIPFDKAKDWGALGWVRPIIGVMMDGQADSADYHLREILPDETRPAEQRYFRFDTELDLALDDMDAANRANIDALKSEAAQILDVDKAAFDRLVALLD